MMASSRRNIGVQPVLDGIVDYLPNPSQRPPPSLIAPTLSRIWSSSGSTDHAPPALLTFKIFFDNQHGPLSFTRVFSGIVKPGMQIKNWTRSDLGEAPTVEKVGLIRTPFALCFVLMLRKLEQPFF